MVLTLVGVELVCRGLLTLYDMGPPGRVPTPRNTSAYSCMYSLVVGKGWVFPFIVIEFLHHETCEDSGLWVVLDLALVAALCSSWAVWLGLGVLLRLSIDCAVFVDCKLWFEVFRLWM